MSVLIKGMEMPKSCSECGQFRWNNFLQTDVCRIAEAIGDDGKFHSENEGIENRPLWCPLVPVPPHGDLIDRSVLYKKTAEWEEQARHLANTAPDARTFDKWATILTERSSFKFDVADAPTIIPAEEGE